MQNVIVVTSGKGGVGKTTTSANLGVGLVREGKKVALVDTDIGLRNLDVVLGWKTGSSMIWSMWWKGLAASNRRSSKTSAMTGCTCCPQHRRGTRWLSHRNR